MSRVAVLGDPARVACWALTGAIAAPASGTDDTRQAWDDLPDDVEVVVLTPAAAAALGDRIDDRLVVILP